jgi:hypothetical protein
LTIAPVRFVPRCWLALRFPRRPVLRHALTQSRRAPIQRRSDEWQERAGQKPLVQNPARRGVLHHVPAHIRRRSIVLRAGSGANQRRQLVGDPGLDDRNQVNDVSPITLGSTLSAACLRPTLYYTGTAGKPTVGRQQAKADTHHRNEGLR